MGTEMTQEKIKQFRKTKGAIPEFTKALMGGYQCKEVDAYILNVKENMDHSQALLQEKLEESTNELALLSGEKGKLLQTKKECEEKIEQLALEVRRKTEAETQARADNARLQKTTEALRRQLESDDRKNSIEENKRLTEEVEELNLQRDRLTVENNAFKKTAEMLNERMAEIKKQNDALKAALVSAAVSKRNSEMATNLKLYEYKQKHASNMEYACNSLSELEKTLNEMKENMQEMYKNTRMQTDMEKETSA